MSAPAPAPLTIVKCEALLLDMDGVLAEVSSSYRQSILLTCSHYLKTSTLVTHAVVNKRKQEGGCNNDWILSLSLIEHFLPTGEVRPTLEEVTQTFEDFYQGNPKTPEVPGLHTLETLIPRNSLLFELRARCPGKMAIVTGRPRSDCMKFLRLHGLESLFDYCYCMEDGPAKPHAFPVSSTCEKLGVAAATAVIVGDTPDDVRSGLDAGARALGVATPGDFEEHEAKGEMVGTFGLSRSCMDEGAERCLKPGLEELLEYFAAVAV